MHRWEDKDVCRQYVTNKKDSEGKYKRQNKQKHDFLRTC